MESDGGAYQAQIICPILSQGEAIGAVVILNRNGNKEFGEVEAKVASTAAIFLGKTDGALKKQPLKGAVFLMVGGHACINKGSPMVGGFLFPCRDTGILGFYCP